MNNVATHVHFRGYTNRNRVESEIDQLLEELFTLEFQDTTCMDEDALETRRRKIKYITHKIDRQKDLLLYMPPPVVAKRPDPIPDKKTESISGWMVFWFWSSVIAAFFYYKKSNEYREVKELAEARQETNWKHLAKIAMLERQLADLTGDHLGLQEEHKDLEVHDALVTIDRDKLKEENAIAWRWYDRHTAKINKLEKEISALTVADSSVTFEGVQAPDAYCVATASAENKTVRCYSNKTSTEYIIHFKFYPNIRKDDVLGIDNKHDTLRVVGKDLTYKIDRVYKYFNDDDPHERVYVIQ